MRVLSKRLLHQSPGLIVLLSLFLVIMLGTFLLNLPVAQHIPTSLLDTFFTATSATCVTGLFTVPLDHFTTFGHIIIMILMQVGGLGLITLTLMFLSFFINFGLSTQLMMGHMLDLESWRNIKNLLLFIAAVTIISELLGTICVTAILAPHEPFLIALFHGMFHAIAAFCNAGIELPGEFTHLYKINYLLLIVTMILSFIGGLGFITWHEIVSAIQTRLQGKRFRFSLHSKIIFYGSFVLLAASTLIIWCIEYNKTFAAMSMVQSWLYALFLAVTSKSTGFSIIPFSDLHLATVCIMMVVAFIGASPASTGSGVKITTFTLMLATIKATLAGRTSVDIKGRRIALDQVLKSVAICFIGIASIMFFIFILLLLQPSWPFFNVVFEAWSALTNLGASTGYTATLSTLGKIAIIMGMIIGRVGTFTLIIELKLIRRRESNDRIYPEERVML